MFTFGVSFKCTTNRNLHRDYLLSTDRLLSPSSVWIICNWIWPNFIGMIKVHLLLYIPQPCFPLDEPFDLCNLSLFSCIFPKKYNHIDCTRPHNMFSSTRWIITWNWMSNICGGKCNSISHNETVANSLIGCIILCFYVGGWQPPK